MAQTIRNLALLLPLLMLGSVAEAQIYRWVDEHGVTQYTTTPPPEAATRDRQTFDRRGRERDLLAAPPTEQDREREAVERERQRLEADRLAEEQRRIQAEHAAVQARTRQLRQLYASVDEIGEARDRRLARASNTLEVSVSVEETLELERQRVLADMEKRRRDRSSQERFQVQIDDLDRRIAREREQQERQRALMAEIEAGAQRDIEDYIRLVQPLSDAR